jgi:hypothetical protein
MEVTFENGDPVGFVILERDAAELHLTVAKDHPAGTRNVTHLMVADATGLHDRQVAHSTRMVKGPRDADHGIARLRVRRPRRKPHRRRPAAAHQHFGEPVKAAPSCT